MSKLLDAVKESTQVKLGVAVMAGVAVGVVSTIAIQSYGDRRVRKAESTTAIRLLRVKPE